MNTLELTGYKNRLVEGGIVYVVEQEENDEILDATDFPLTVRKATIIDNSPERVYPILSLWSLTSVKPSSIGIIRTKDPHAIFTPEEVKRAVNAYDDLTDLDHKNVDELIAEPYKNRQLAGVLGESVIRRTADNWLSDPEF
jgi:hypothetical protein